MQNIIKKVRNVKCYQKLLSFSDSKISGKVKITSVKLASNIFN